MTAWRDGDSWRVDTRSADQSNTSGVRGVDDPEELTDTQIVGLLLAEASNAWEAY